MSDYVLRKGSYNGKEFYTTSAETVVGRRNVVFEYPDQDDPDVEDLGRAARRHSITFFIIGPDFIKKSKELLDELEKPGVHELVHPWHGLKKVRPMTGRVRMGAQENRMASVAADVVEVPALTHTPTTVPGAELANAAAALDIAAAFALEEGMSTKGPVSLLKMAEASVQKALDAVAAATDALNTVNDVADRLLAMQQNLTSLVLTPANLGLQLMGAVRAVTNGHFDPISALRTQLAILENVIRPRAAGTGSIGLQAAKNDRLVSVFTRAVAMAEAARLVSGAATRDSVAVQGVAFETRDEAQDFHASLKARLDELMLDAPDSLFPALRSLSVQLAKDFRDRAPTARITTITIETSVPAVVLAHRLYGDATRADELVARNGIRNPLFVPAGEELEVRHG